MIRLNRRHMLGLLGTSALTACAPAIPMSQLGDDPFEGGIGGTGIVGVMTGTGSVLINGLRVEVPERARIMAGGRRVSDSALVPGTALSLVAQARLGRFEAVSIDVDAPLIGTLTRQGQRMTINATAVQLEAGVSAAGLTGQRVMAHGLWQPDGSLRASLVQRAVTPSDSIAGVVEGSPATGWRMGQTPVQPRRGQVLILGQFAVATGQFTDGALQAESIVLGRFRGAQSLRQLSIEGYLEPIAAAPGFRISGLGHSFDRRLALDPFVGHRAVYFGPYDGRFRARRAVTLPEGSNARTALLRPDDAAPFAPALIGAAAHRIATR